MSLHILGSPVVVGLALIGSAPALAQVLPKVAIDDVSVLETNGGADRARFTVSLTGMSVCEPVLVKFFTTGGTAREGTSCAPGVDFVGIHPQQPSARPPSAIEIMMPPGGNEIRIIGGRMKINVAVCSDTGDEPDETFLIHIFSASCAEILDGVGQATIIDDDPPPLPWEGLAVSSSIAKAEEQRWQTPTLPAGDYQFDLSGTSGDADLYVRIGSPPTLQNYSCRPAKSGSNETCLVSLGQPQVIHVMVRGYAPSTAFALVGRAQ